MKAAAFSCWWGSFLAAFAISQTPACSPSFGFPAVVVPERPQAGDYPDVGYAVLEDVATLEYRPSEVSSDGSTRLVAVLDHMRRMKILSSRGLAAARVELPVDGFSTVTRVIARSVTPDGKTETMSQGLVAVASSLSGALGAAAPELKTLRFVVPGATVGGLIEYRYERVFVDPNLVSPWVFADSVPVLRSEFGIIVAPELKVDYRYFRNGRVVDRRPLSRQIDDNRTRLVFVETNLAPIYPEPLMPGRERLAPSVAVVLTRARVDGMSYQLETWSDVAQHVLRLTEPVGGKLIDERPSTVYRRLRDTLVGLPQPGLGVRSAVAARDLLAGAPACSRDAAALLFTSLSGGTARAHLALLTTPAGPPVLPGFPALYPFVRAVVAVDVREELQADRTCRGPPLDRNLICGASGSGYAFLDTLCPGCRFGELPTELTGGKALLITPEGPKWLDVPNDPPERNRWVANFRLRLDIDGILTGSVEGEVTGAIARDLHSAVGRTKSEDVQAESLRKVLFGGKSDLKLERVKLGEPTVVDRPLEVKARLTSHAQEEGAERFRIRPAALLGPSLAGDWRRSRRSAALLKGPAWVETTATIHLPVGYEVNSPPVARLVTPFAEYAAGFARRGRVLHYSRRFVLKRRVITPKQWSDFYELMLQIQHAETAGALARGPDQ